MTELLIITSFIILIYLKNNKELRESWRIGFYLIGIYGLVIVLQLAYMLKDLIESLVVDNIINSLNNRKAKSS